MSTPKHTILIVDDEEDIRTSLAGILEDEGYATRLAESGPAALDSVTEKMPDMVLLDIWMEGMDGLEVLTRLKRRAPNLPVVMISGHGTIETAVSATQKGAYDFIEKPPQVERLLLIVSRAIREAQLARENALLRSRNGEVRELLGVSSEIAAVRQAIRQVSAGDSRILITGEPGTGKEIVARLIHQNSHRAGKAFASLSPAAISDETLEPALLAMAGENTGGTLFLDEIADLTPAMQARILRFLQDRMLTDPRTGARHEVDMRVVSATSRDIKTMVDNGKFRADLYYRLNVVPVHVPSLRERTVDNATMVENYLKIMTPDSASMQRLAPATMAVLTSYQWPGNVRQLKNMIEWVTIMHPGKVIVPDMLPPEITRADKSNNLSLLEKTVTLPLRQARELFERDYLANQLQRFSGNVSRTADFVGMERSALHRKLKSLGVDARVEGPTGLPMAEEPAPAAGAGQNPSGYMQ